MLTTVFLIWLGIVASVDSHGRLWIPTARSTLWRENPALNLVHDYNDNQLFCGGVGKQYNEENDGKCGVCGDEYSQDKPRAHEEGGEFVQFITIVEQYESAQIINVTVQITANHKGYFEFRLCVRDDSTTALTHACLNQHLLKDPCTNRTKHCIGSGEKYFTVMLSLPNVTCEMCVLQWKYNTGNNVGECGNGKCSTECYTTPEQFYGCADIAINPGNSETNANLPEDICETRDNTAIHGNCGKLGEWKNGVCDSDEVDTGYNDENDDTDSDDSFIPIDQFSKSLSMYQWCLLNCGAGNCSSSNCQPSDGTNGDCEPSDTFQDVPGMANWCTVNCAAGFCPASHCSSACTGSESEEDTSGCKAAGAYVNTPGMDAWCVANCAAGYCPASHCTCD